MDNKILSIFQKHIGNQESFAQKTRAIENIKDTNSIIGALQTLDLALKKCHSSIHETQRIEEIISRCLFMGEALFDREIQIPILQKNLYVANIHDLLKSNSIEEVEHFIIDKREEIQALLGGIFENLNQEDDCYTSPQKQAIHLEKFF